ncbi:YraN family protein [Luteolibacter pohnpeiensis]|uniref:UPF0102 protein JIN85_12780 n=1 Tax=Luteolibacter pohnpeiensis TaxID=454153 RepID=A0A934VX92_9BACT|nr:YraN family protein [Luteolibacter pohnpeiensis]MBK1883294.1 YraN family protein [Luteolibacter pohnpeiensis]
MKLFGPTDLVAIIVARFSRSLNCNYRSVDQNGVARDHLAIGEYGEIAARDWLRAQGCKILYRNFRAPRGGEVDIVARDQNLLLFIEVKTRQEHTKIRPLDAVGKSKQALIERGANAWLKRLGHRNIPWRFDVIEVYVEDGKKPRLVWIKDAF